MYPAPRAQTQVSSGERLAETLKKHDEQKIALVIQDIDSVLLLVCAKRLAQCDLPD